MATLKYSRQRESILSYLRSTTAHPTAETVFEHVKEVCPSISLGTVYRDLKQLETLGTIQRISCGDSNEHYDGNVSPHYHLFCRCCGNVSDIHMPLLADLNQLAAHYTEGAIEGHFTIFRGLCATCAKSQKEAGNIGSLHESV